MQASGKISHRTNTIPGKSHFGKISPQTNVTPGKYLLGKSFPDEYHLGKMPLRENIVRANVTLESFHVKQAKIKQKYSSGQKFLNDGITFLFLNRLI
jgi:hypothetical protein